MLSLRLYSFALASALTLAPAVHAASPFVGKWKFNATKSKLTGTTDSIATAGPNAWKFTYGSFSWTVKADGTDQSTPFGNTVAMTALGPSKWQLTNKVNGKLMSTDTWELSSDGKTMTRTSAGKRENGDAFNEVTTVKRTAGASGFEGTWVSTDYKGAPPEFDIAANGDDGIALMIPADSVKVALKFDGKEYPIEGPRVPPGLTYSAKLEGARKASAVAKMKDKPMDTETWEVSADGKTFTYTERDAGEDASIVAVYDRM